MKPGTEVLITRPGWEGNAVIKCQFSKYYYLVVPEFDVSYGFGVVFHKKYLKKRDKNGKRK